MSEIGDAEIDPLCIEMIISALTISTADVSDEVRGMQMMAILSEIPTEMHASAILSAMKVASSAIQLLARSTATTSGDALETVALEVRGADLGAEGALVSGEVTPASASAMADFDQPMSPVADEPETSYFSI